MSKLTTIAAAALSAALLTTSPAQATPLGAAANIRLPSEMVSPLTNVWGHHRFFHHRVHHRFHRFHGFHRW